MAKRKPIKIYASRPTRVELKLGEHEPRAKILDISEAADWEPLIVQPTLPDRKVMHLMIAGDLSKADVSAHLDGLASTDPVEVQVAHGDRLELEDIGDLIDAADRTGHELRIELLQQDP